MRTLPGRRDFLRATAGLATALTIPRLVPAAAPASLSVSSLGDGLVLISGAGGNVVALSAPEGLLVVDGGLEEHSRELMKLLAQLPAGHHIHTVFNTHWHWDHTGSNELFRKAGATVIGHENTRLWLGTPVWEAWEQRRYPPRPKAQPTQSFYKTGQLTFGGQPIEYGYLPQAHTDGDIYVYFRHQNVLLAGDVVSVGSYPILDYCTGGWIGGMVDATQRLLDLTDEKTRIVPGSGPVQTRADVAIEHEMLATLKEDLWQLMRKGMGADDMIAARATSKYDAKWGKSDLFVANAYMGLYGHVREMRGVV
jgi:cyclase